MPQEKVVIFGKPSCPFTRAARQAFADAGRDVRFIDVKANPLDLDDMLRHSGGDRRIPVIVDGGTVSIGWGGKA